MALFGTLQSRDDTYKINEASFLLTIGILLYRYATKYADPFVPFLDTIIMNHHRIFI
jgi:hypothetical protein